MVIFDSVLDLKRNLQLNETRDGEYTEIIRGGVLKIEKLKQEIENERQIQNQMEADLRKGDKKTKNIRVKSAQLRDKVHIFNIIQWVSKKKWPHFL